MDNVELIMSFGLTRQEARVYILLLGENVKIVTSQKMPTRHFYSLRHHIFFYIKFLVFCFLAPDGN